MRAFIIGNGASLNDTPLDLLRDEFTIGMNRLHRKGLDWDPTWWVLADMGATEDWDFPTLLDRKSAFLFREHDRFLIEPLCRPNAFFFGRCEHIGGDYLPTEWHLPLPCEYGGSASIAIQLAVHLGKNPIYVLGMDLYSIRGVEDINHFDPAYCRYKDFHGKQETWDTLNQRLILAHQIARKSAIRMGVHIYNAGVGGSLEVYERVSLEDVLSEPQTQEA